MQDCFLAEGMVPKTLGLAQTAAPRGPGPRAADAASRRQLSLLPSPGERQNLEHTEVGAKGLSWGAVSLKDTAALPTGMTMLSGSTWLCRQQLTELPRPCSLQSGSCDMSSSMGPLCSLSRYHFSLSGRGRALTLASTGHG